MQAACRKNGWPLDRSTLYTTVTTHVRDDEINERPQTGCYVKGLYLEGASWDRKGSVLEKPIPKQLVCELPILRVIPIEAHKLKLHVRRTLFIYIYLLPIAIGLRLIFTNKYIASQLCVCY